MDKQLDDKRISALTEELDAAIPKHEAIVAVDRVYKPIGLIITANQSGLFRLGVECLRIGLCEDASRATDFEQLKYLNSGPFSSVVELQRDDGLEKTDPKLREPRPDQPKRKRKGSGVVVFASLFVLCGMVGAFTLLRQLLGLIF